MHNSFVSKVKIAAKKPCVLARLMNYRQISKVLLIALTLFANEKDIYELALKLFCMEGSWEVCIMEK